MCIALHLNNYNIKRIVYNLIKQKDQLFAQGCTELKSIIISKYSHGSYYKRMHELLSSDLVYFNKITSTYNSVLLVM